MTKTMGKFTVSSKFSAEFTYQGYSKQCEVAFRDYMSWCEKEKAPKAIQNEYDRVIKEKPELKGKTDEIFSATVIPMTPEEFTTATNKKVATAPANEAPATKPESMEDHAIRILAAFNSFVDRVTKNDEIADKQGVLDNLIEQLTKMSRIVITTESSGAVVNETTSEIASEIVPETTETVITLSGETKEIPLVEAELVSPDEIGKITEEQALATKDSIHEIERQIYDEYVNGRSLKELSQAFNLSTREIKEITVKFA